MKTRVHKGAKICIYSPCSGPHSMMLPYFHNGSCRIPVAAGVSAFPLLHPHPFPLGHLSFMSSFHPSCPCLFGAKSFFMAHSFSLSSTLFSELNTVGIMAPHP